MKHRRHPWFFSLSFPVLWFPIFNEPFGYQDGRIIITEKLHKQSTARLVFGNPVCFGTIPSGPITNTSTSKTKPTGICTSGLLKWSTSGRVKSADYGDWVPGRFPVVPLLLRLQWGQTVSFLRWAWSSWFCWNGNEIRLMVIRFYVLWWCKEPKPDNSVFADWTIL